MLNGWGKGGRQRPAEGVARAAFCSGTPPRSGRQGATAGRAVTSIRNPQSTGGSNHQDTKARGNTGTHGGTEDTEKGQGTGNRGQETAESFPEARAAFCSGTPPRSEGGRRAAGPTPVGAGSRAATKRKRIVAQRPNPQIHECPNASPPHFVAERLRVPRGAAGCGAHSRRRGKPRRYEKAIASPRRGGIHESTILSSFPRRPRTRPGAWTSARKVPRASLPVGISNANHGQGCPCHVEVPAGADAPVCHGHPCP